MKHNQQQIQLKYWYYAYLVLVTEMAMIGESDLVPVYPSLRFRRNRRSATLIAALAHRSHN